MKINTDLLENIKLHIPEDFLLSAKKEASSLPWILQFN